MTNPFPKCISKNCPVESKCLRKLDGDITAEVDYDKVDMGINDKCVWFIEIKNEISGGDNDEKDTI